MGGDEDPDETPLSDARRRVESLWQEIQDLRRAAEYGYTDLLRVVSAGRDPYREKLAGEVVRESEKVAKLEAELATRRHAMESKATLDRWLESPEGSLSVGPAPQAPLNPQAAA